jgi:hypothetical protein
MRRAAGVLLLGCALSLAANASALAQDEPSRIGPFVIDVRGALPGFPGDPALAASRGLLPDELPGRLLGLDAGAHVYLFQWKAVTLGVGAQLTALRGSAEAPSGTGLRTVSSRLVSFAPQLSFNFGTGNGWSYLSGGMGSTQWSITPEGQGSSNADEERLRTFNYGGGARWFAKPHLAFTFDIRFHAIDAGTIYPGGRPGAPRTRLLVMSAGVSVR